MPITTRTIAKGVAPRLHQPKPTKKHSKKTVPKPKKSHKRVASDSDEEESDSTDSEPRVKKKHTKQQRQSSEDEVEVNKLHIPSFIVAISIIILTLLS